MKCWINGTADEQLGETLSGNALGRRGPEQLSLKHPELSGIYLRTRVSEAEYLDALMNLLRGRWSLTMLQDFPVKRIWHVIANYRAFRCLDQQATLVGLQQMVFNEVSMMALHFQREAYADRLSRLEQRVGAASGEADA